MKRFIIISWICLSLLSHSGYRKQIDHKQVSKSVNIVNTPVEKNCDSLSAETKIADKSGFIGEKVNDGPFERFSGYANKYIIIKNKDLASCYEGFK